MKLHFFPKDIAGQIILLVILSAIIFHLSISIAFLIGSGFFRPQDRDAESRFIDHIGDFMKMADGLASPDRKSLVVWLQADDPRLGIKIGTPPEAPATDPNSYQVADALQARVGPDVRVNSVNVHVAGLRISNTD